MKRFRGHGAHRLGTRLVFLSTAGWCVLGFTSASHKALPAAPGRGGGHFLVPWGLREGSLPRKMEMMSRSACSDAPRDVANLLRLRSWKPHRSTVASSATAPTSPSAADAILAPAPPGDPSAPRAPNVGTTLELHPQFRPGARPRRAHWLQDRPAAPGSADHWSARGGGGASRRKVGRGRGRTFVRQR